MSSLGLKTIRKKQGWNQSELARRLGVSQPLVSLLESGERVLTPEHLQKFRQMGFELDAGYLPMRQDFETSKLNYARELANLDYPRFAHLKVGEPTLHPMQLLMRALSQPNLERRVAEALPWLVVRYCKTNWDWHWLRDNAKVRDLQNRLGFTLTLARKVAMQTQFSSVAALLRKQETQLRDSVLARQDTYCYESMTKSERKWLAARRPEDAAAWHVLSDLDANQLAYA